MRKTQPVPTAAISTPAIAGPNTRPRLNVALPSATALGSCRRSTISGDEGLPYRGVEAAVTPSSERQHVDLPDLRVPGDGEQPEDERLQCPRPPG